MTIDPRRGSRSRDGAEPNARSTKSSHKPRVLIADEHPTTVMGIRSTLESEGFEVCAEVNTAMAAIEVALARRPDVCLLDVSMPGGGLQAAARISKVLKDSVIIMFASSPDPDVFIDAIRAGAFGYLLKDIAPERLVAAIRGALSGEAAVPRSLTTRLIEEYRDREITRLMISGGRSVHLTPRERDVLRLLRQNLTTHEIAERLFVSSVTVRTHISSILKKSQAEDRNSVIGMLEDTAQ